MLNFKLNSILLFSEKNEKYFFSEFGDGLNVIHGRNTSGKSTLIQLILFAMGVNDDRIKLAKILAEEIFVRLDCSLTNEDITEELIFIRSDDNIHIKRSNKPVLNYIGVNANNSNEHIKLKKFTHELFHFDLQLESKFGIKDAPIEIIFLPYYVAQSIGWVYLRKSFSNLEFYKNLKDDYLDYYLGIKGSSLDRKEKKELEDELVKVNQEIKFYKNYENSNEELQIAELINEEHKENAKNYIEIFAANQAELIKVENDFVNKSNEVSFYRQRISVLSKVKRNMKLQNPGEDNCPTCTQILPKKVENVYDYFQEKNDTDKELKQYKEKLKSLQSNLNSLENKITEIRNKVSEDYEIIKKYESKKVTFDTWVDSKANLKLAESVTFNLGRLTQDKEEIKGKLKKFATDEEITKQRNIKNKDFKSIFEVYLSEMNLPEIEEDRFTKLYSISSFPFQGVELLKTVMCYHFAFNRLINETEYIHRLPFILDGIFKEDVDGVNRKKILNFIYKNKPKDTQTIISIADAKEENSTIEEENKNHFQGKAKLICIGEGIYQRALLRPHTNQKSELIKETFEIIESE